MKIQIVGAGVVGQATGKGFARLGHGVTYVDKDPNLAAYFYASEFATEPSPGADVYFICTPEGAVEEAMATLLREPVYRGLPEPGYAATQDEVPGTKMGERLPFVAIRSTVPPGTARKLGDHVCSNPEFLREAVSEYDFMNPPGIIIGACCDAHATLLVELYNSLRRPIHVTDRDTAELTKLAVNGYLACQVSYWNQVKVLADKLGVNSQKVGMLATFGDGRVSTYGARMHGRPYGGHCLPKDLDQLIRLCKEHAVEGDLFDAVKLINEIVVAP